MGHGVEAGRRAQALQAHGAGRQAGVRNSPLSLTARDTSAWRQLYRAYLQQLLLRASGAAANKAYRVTAQRMTKHGVYYDANDKQRHVHMRDAR